MRTRLHNKQVTSRQKFRDCLEHCPPPHGGQTHSWIMRTANYAAWSAISAKQAELAMLSKLGVRDEDKQSEVRAALSKAYAERGQQAVFGAKARKPTAKERKAPLTIERHLQRGAERIGPVESGELYLARHSPVQRTWGDDWRFDAIIQLLAMFRPGEMVWGGVCGNQVWAGRRNWGLAKTCQTWCEGIAFGDLIPPLVCINPLRQDYPQGPSNPPKAADIGVFRQTLFEIDERLDGTPFPIEDQIRFLVGWGLDPFVTLTFSGGKSVHGVFPVYVSNAAEWDAKVKHGLFPRVFIPYGADPQCADPSRKTRLGGAWRVDQNVPEGARQQLLYAKRRLT